MMHITAFNKGMSHPDVLVISRRLDEAINGLYKVGPVEKGNYQKCVDTKKSITYEEELSLPGGVRIWLTTLTPIMERGSVSNIVGSAEFCMTSTFLFFLYEPQTLIIK